MTVVVWPLEAVPVMAQQPSWPLDGQPPLTLVLPLVHIVPAGTVMHSDMSGNTQLTPPPLLLDVEQPPSALDTPTARATEATATEKTFTRAFLIGCGVTASTPGIAEASHRRLFPTRL